MCLVHKMVGMYRTARKGIAWHPPIRIHLTFYPFLSESKPKLEPGMDPEFELEFYWSKLENNDEDVHLDELILRTSE
jgi:hypothetical protein